MVNMNEFALIDQYFKSIVGVHEDVHLGIGDDAACVSVPAGYDLVISCDTLVSDVHFLSSWDAFDIAWKAVMVNVSDMAAMGATPKWLLLALTLPDVDEPWIKRFSQGLQAALAKYGIALIGGDTTRGPLSMTLTIHGIVPKGKAVKRSNAKPGDRIYVSGPLGAPTLALEGLNDLALETSIQEELMEKLLRPIPRVDLIPFLQDYASAAIDISDGFSADLNHVCTASQVGALIDLKAVPIHHALPHYCPNPAEFALNSGDEYELCFTVSPLNEDQMLRQIAVLGIQCYAVGFIEKKLGLRARDTDGQIVPLNPKGYRHF